MKLNVKVTKRPDVSSIVCGDFTITKTKDCPFILRDNGFWDGLQFLQKDINPLIAMLQKAKELSEGEV